MPGLEEILMLLAGGAGSAATAWDDVEARRLRERQLAQQDAAQKAQQARQQVMDTTALHERGFRSEAQAQPLTIQGMSIPGASMPAQPTDRFDSGRYERVGQGLVFDRVDNPEAREERFRTAQGEAERRFRAEQAAAQVAARREEAAMRAQEAAERASQDRATRLQIAEMGRANRQASGGQGASTEGERRAAALLQVADNAFPVLAQATAPGRGEAMLAKIGANEALSQERQVVEQAAKQFVTSYLYVVSGATASPQEVENLVAQIVPAPGDKPETLARKRAAQQAMMNALRQVSGRAAGPTSAAPQNPWR